ncbi:glycoside hydrolase/deacetylase [Mycena alexandri]|uniref:chitin deacetylase n=1 Tax=Mycena alexandri TaxID=1745969 RepID=A0AAD6XAE7_9AGAR|nr:glycoside hydrolase/deacetylase [Mycena alexandri]
MRTFALLTLPLLSLASVHRRHEHNHAHNIAKRLPSPQWYHEPDHPVHELFRRGAPTDGVTYAAVGSAEWAAPYPPGPPASPDVKLLPAAWVAALNDAIARKAIPDIPLATNVSDGGSPVYPSAPKFAQQLINVGSTATSGANAADGHVGLSFDDGPEAGTASLLEFLDQQKQQVTHFMIGSNIIYQPNDFLNAFNRGDDIAVHTWTHPHMTTQSNLQVLGELGWTIQIIHNSTGGRVPKFWRPPYGDSDVRTRAIAKEVFGLTTIIWNQDTSDWSLDESPPGTTADKIKASMQQWLTGPKSPGLIILEHEITNDSVASFVAAYPVMKSNGWNVVSLAQLVGNNASYQNSASNSGPVIAADALDAKSIVASSSAPALSPSGAANSGSNANSNNTQKVGAAQTSAGSAPSSSPKPSSASPRWATGPSAIFSTVVLLMLWK